ncbi:hypothetical protein MASR2M8_24340 [Opitutaceae bacterium]
MKTLLSCLLIALLAGLTSFGLTRWIASQRAPANEMAWLRKEFALSAAQADAIEKLHARYSPVCDEHCARVMAAQQRLAGLERGTPAHAEASAEMQRLTQICTESTRSHLEAVAALMDPRQGARYLELVGTKVASHSHAEPLGLR